MSVFIICVSDFYLIGLVNGAQGVVRKIWYAPNADIHQKCELPAVVFVEIPGYSGMVYIDITKQN